MVPKIEAYYARYDAAPNDWTAWGRDREQACRNKRTYDQYLECGYTGEPCFDEYGWINNEIPKEQIETIRLFGNETLPSTVECIQLPNGKWVGGVHYNLSLAGCACGCSMWGEQYDTRIACLTAKMLIVRNAIRNSTVGKDKEHLTDIVRAMDNLRQLSLF